MGREKMALVFTEVRGARAEQGNGKPTCQCEENRRLNTRSSACVSAVAGTHAPGRGEGVEGLGGWLRYIISYLSS